MSRYTTESYRTFLRERLEPLTVSVICELRGFLAQSCLPGVRRIEVTVPARPLGERLTVTLRLRGEAAGLSGTVGDAVLEAWTPSWGGVLFSEERVEVRCYHDAGVETLEIELQTVIEWFAGCWQAAGGPAMSLPAYISVEHDLEALNLTTLAWESLPISQPGEKSYGKV